MSLFRSPIPSLLAGLLFAGTGWQDGPPAQDGTAPAARPRPGWKVWRTRPAGEGAPEPAAVRERTSR
jgi:hypothetical protein